MTFFIIFGALCLIIYVITFNNRDKSQDYQINPKIGYQNLVNEDKMRIDMTVGLESQIKNIIGSNPQENKELVNRFIESYRRNCLNDILGVASNYKIPMHLATSIINEICDGAYGVYILEL